MRLIDADELLKGIAELKQSPWYENFSGRFFRKEAVEIIEDLCIKKAPTVDAVTYEEWFSTNCETCKEYDKEKHCCPKFRGVIKQTLKDFEENNKIVRCEDCKHWCNKREDGGFDCCTRAIVNRFKPTDYCSYGERKDEDCN